MQFQYRARDRGGQLVEGRMEAGDQPEALAVLSGQGLFVSSIQPVEGHTGDSAAASQFAVKLPAFGPAKAKPTPQDLANFCDQGGSLIASGVTVLQMLRVMSQQVKAKRLGVILHEVAQAVEQGSTLGEVFSRYKDELPNSMVQIIRVAEVAGNLDEGLMMLGKYFDQEDRFKRKVQSATMYPKIVVFVTFGVMIFMMAVVLPRFGAMFASMGAKLPGPTLFMLAVANFVQHEWYVWVPGLAGIWLGVRYVMRTNEQAQLWWHTWMLKLPIIGPLSFNQDVGRFVRTLGTLLRSGVPIVNALTVAQNTLDNLAMRRVIAGATQQVEIGEGLVPTLRSSKLFPPSLVEMLAVGEVTGNVEQSLFRIGDYCERDVSSALDRLGASIEPILVVVLGVIMLVIMVPLLLPMFDMYGHIH